MKKDLIHLLMLPYLFTTYTGWTEEIEDHLHDRWYAAEVIVFTQDISSETMVDEQLAINTPEPLPLNIISYQSNFENLLPLYTSEQHQRISRRVGYCDINSTLALIRKIAPDQKSNDISHLVKSQKKRIDTVTVKYSSEEASLKISTETPVIQWPGGIDPPHINPHISLIAASFSAPNIEPYLEKNITMVFLARVAEFENTLRKKNFLPNQDPELQMKNYANRLKRLNASRILVHKRWTQPVPERTNPQPIYIQAGDFLEDSYELEGTISLTARRFLHFEAKLVYQDPEQRQDLGDLDSDQVVLENPLYMLMSETRRMRSGEIHYLDHPKFGVIVRVDPVNFSPELVSSFQDLQKSQQ